MPWFIYLLLLSAVAAQPLEIVNDYGAVHVEILADNRLQAWRADTPEQLWEGIAVSRSPARLLIEALPPEGGDAPDLEVRVPLASEFFVRTQDGSIRLTGMARRARVQSIRGALTISAPLDVTQINIETTYRPPVTNVARAKRLRFAQTLIHPRLQVWTLSNSLSSRDLRFGLIQGTLHSPPALTVRDWPIPRDWPLKPHTLSTQAVARLLASAERRKRRGAAPPRPSPRDLGVEAAPGMEALFTSEVRMVSMSVAVADSGGRPLDGLKRADFVVEENGERQEIQVVDPEESPFNMAILLDLSGSTAVDLEHMRQATVRLIQMAGPNDRVALYAMSGSLFHRLTPLTSDRATLMAHCRRLPYPAGGSPLWDVVALVYDDELSQHAGERNALVVISDGIDNRISGQSVPSMLKAARLTEAAAEMDARIYPIFLLSGERFGRNWSTKARARMEALARKTGGRLFQAQSVADIEPVLPALAREMRSVYEIAYYPADQDFDGSWRQVRIKVGLPGAQVRARPGYFAD